MDSKALASKRIDHVVPEYPIDARRAHIEGTVLFDVVISATGVPRSIELVANANTLLNRAAFDAVRQFRYLPATIDGQPVEVEATVCVMFTLGGDKPLPPQAPDKKVDQKWIKAQRDALAALDPASVANIRRLLQASGMNSEALKKPVIQFLDRSRILITGYFPTQKEPREIAAGVISKVSSEVDTDLLFDLMVLVYAKHLSPEHADSTTGAMQTAGAKPSSDQQSAIDADAVAALRDYYSKFLVPEIDAEIRRINKN